MVSSSESDEEKKKVEEPPKKEYVAPQFQKWQKVKLNKTGSSKTQDQSLNETAKDETELDLSRSKSEIIQRANQRRIKMIAKKAKIMGNSDAANVAMQGIINDLAKDIPDHQRVWARPGEELLQYTAQNQQVIKQQQAANLINGAVPTAQHHNQQDSRGESAEDSKVVDEKERSFER